MKKVIPVLLAAVVLILVYAAAAAEDWQNEARSMLTLINEFRTGDNAWYWNRNNRTTTVETGLSGLVYDYQLEEIAKIRAAEIVQSFSHTRPDGRKWDSAFPAGNYYKGENLACGFESAADAFEGFREENEDYDGQGHRRNMLRRQFTRIGMAAVEADGTVYWVQEFASGDAVSAAPSDARVSWILEDGKYVCRNAAGNPVTGWIQDDGIWYYMDHNGPMQTGWIRDGGSWYCLDTNGVMRTGWIKDNNKWYYSNSKGVMQTGWVQDGGKWYHFGRNGMMDTGWIKEKGKWYYCGDSGEMVTGRCTVEGQTEVFDEYGVWQYSEINDYDTPLGAGPWMLLLRTIRFCLKNLLALFRPTAI